MITSDIITDTATTSDQTLSPWPTQDEAAVQSSKVTEVTDPMTLTQDDPFERLLASLDYQVTKGVIIYGGSLLMVVGTAGNLVSLLVLLRSRGLRRRAGGLYLMVLAVLDTLLLDFGLSTFILDILGIHVSSYSEVGCKLAEYCFIVLYECEAWVLVNMSVERLVAVYLPLHAKVLYTRRRAGLLLLLTTLIIALVNVVYLHILELQGGECYTGVGYEDMYERLYWLDFSLMSAAPFLLMLGCSLAIVARITLSNIQRNAMTSTQAIKVSGMTLTLLALTFTFLLLAAPVTILPLLGRSKLDEKTRGRVYIASLLADFISYLNYVINIYLYCVSNAHFRAEMMAMCCRLKTTRSSSSSSGGGGSRRVVRSLGSSTCTSTVRESGPTEALSHI